MSLLMSAGDIAKRVPHHGLMAWLDGLIEWSDTRIVCRASNHRDADHPLRTPHGLLASCTIEYAAQAMALHGALCAESAGAAVGPVPGFLASARSVQLGCWRIDDAEGPLRIEAERQAGDNRQLLYQFRVADASGRTLAQGRATVVLNTPLIPTWTQGLSGKRALITGASGALGAAMARRLARDGASLLLHANSRPEAVQALAHEIQAAGGQAQAVVFDLTDAPASQAACDEMLAGGAVQVIVNNAGVHDDAVFPAMRAEQWHRVIDVSLHGFFHVTRPLLLPMLRTRWGRVINISSVAALMGNRGQVNYAAAKGALNSATKALSLEVAARGVTVNAVAPGIIQSPMADAVFDPKVIAEMVPSRRAGTPDEVASLVAFLASAEAGYITGQVISINGGMA